MRRFKAASLASDSSSETTSPALSSTPLSKSQMMRPPASAMIANSKPGSSNNELKTAESRPMKTATWLPAEWADMAIGCGPDLWRVHRLFVCKKSAILAGQLDVAFKTTGKNYVKLHTEDPQLLEYTLMFIYDLSYDEIYGQASENLKYKTASGFVIDSDEDADIDKCSELIIHSILFGMADRYCIEGLMAATKIAFQKTLNNYIKTMEPSRFAHVIQAVFRTNIRDSGLRNVTINTLQEREHYHDLLQDQQIRELATKLPAFALNVIDMLLTSNSSLREELATPPSKRKKVVVKRETRKCTKKPKVEDKSSSSPKVEEQDESD